MSEPILLIMAAGMGSRYGGLKQMDALGPNGEVLLHYSIYDVCGFDDGDPVITIPYSVIKPYLTKEAREMIE